MFYDGNGNIIYMGSSGDIDYDKNVKSVAHRGFSTTAPENTLPAYKLARKNGFVYAEADVSFTSDSVAVLLHDSTIDRTSDGSGTLSAMTYEEVSQYDFGSWKSANYEGTKIPTFSEFIALCKNIGLHPYIELKSNGAYTQEQIVSLVDIVKAHGMNEKVTWISFTLSFLEYVKAADSSARLGYLVNTISEAVVSDATGLKTNENSVFVDAKYSAVTDGLIALCVAADIPVELWTVNNTSIITDMNPYITGVTSDSIIAGKVLYDTDISL